MCQYKRLLKLTILIGFVLQCFNTEAQTGLVKGTIREAANNLPLTGASVYSASNTTLATSADFSGNYELKLPAGKQVIVCSFLGMLADTFTVTVIADKIVVHDCNLKSKGTDMDMVVVSASKYEQRLADVTVSMQLIQPRLIESKNTVNVKTVLDQAPGLNILDDEPQMRGGSGFAFGVGSRVSTLIDGLPILTGDAGRTDWGFIPTENIEQIEILEGASSVLYGSSALSGTINFRTKYPTDTSSTYIRSYTGFYSAPKNKGAKWWNGAANMTGLNFSQAQIIKNSDLIVGGQLNYDHGYIGPYVLDGSLPIKADTITDKDVAFKSARLNFNYRFRPKNVTGLSMGVNGNMMLAHSNFCLVWADDTNGIYKAFPGTMTITDYVGVYLDPFITYFTPNGFKHNFHGRWYFTQNDNSNNQSNSTNMFLGDYQFFKSIEKLGDLNFTGGIYMNQTFSHANIYAGSGSPDNTWQNVAAYMQLDKKLFNVLNVSLGFREEYFKVNTTETVWKPIFRAGLNLKLTNTTNLRWSYGQGYRFPTITERFIITSTGGISLFPNPEIKPESSWSTEIGVKQSIKIGNFIVYADVVAFWQQFQNTIEYIFGNWDPNMAAGFKFLNTGDTRVKGYEISFTGGGKLYNNLSINLLAGYTYILPQTLNPDYVFATDNPADGFIPTDLTYANTSTDTTNNILKYRFQNQVKADVELIYKKISLGASLRYYSFMQNIDNTFYTLDESKVLPTGITKYREIHNMGTTIIDLRTSYQFTKSINAAFIVNNVVNLQYTLRPLKIESPRTFTIQVSARF
jgi:iron complex outermembrane receptor protein